MQAAHINCLTPDLCLAPAVILVLTGGGSGLLTEILSLRISRTASEFRDLGVAAAMSNPLMLLLATSLRLDVDIRSDTASLIFVPTLRNDETCCATCCGMRQSMPNAATARSAVPWAIR